MSDYAQAPACKMMATHCACCGKPLLDAKSVEAGIGPVCRKKYGFDLDVSEDARKRANALVYQLALAVSSGAITFETMKLTGELLTLGFEKIAQIFTHRAATVGVDTGTFDDKPVYFVRVPYDPEGGFNQATWMRTRLKCKRVVPESGSKKQIFHWVFPRDEYCRQRIWNGLVKFHVGALGLADGVPFEVKPLRTAQQKAKAAAIAAKKAALAKKAAPAAPSAAHDPF